jgi:serine/threonine protein phosphatase PrpC
MSEPERESTPPPGDSSEFRSKERAESSGGNGFSDDKTVSEAQPMGAEAGADTIAEKTEEKPSEEAKPELEAKTEETKVEEAKADEPKEPEASEEAPAEKTEAPAEAAEPIIEIKYFGRTHVGLVREHNEDNFLVADLAHAVRGLDHIDAKATHATLTVGPRGAVFAVCDGMGGAAAGEVASQMAVDTVWEYFSHLKEPRDRDHFARRLVSSIEEAGNRIFSAAKMDRTRRGMGTTATVAGLIDKVLFVGQVGDSRAYILREGKLVQITKDQSLVNQLIEAGQLTEDEAEAFDHSNIILQALGTTEEVTVDLTFLELRRGDRLMMCSDGLSGLVHKDMVREVLATTPSLADCTTRLIEMANLGGGHDNITVVCAEFGGGLLSAPAAGDDAVYQQYPLPDGLPDDHESLPPREPRIKEGATKPGADVKRDGSPTEDTPVPRAERAQPESKSSRAVLLFGVILLIALVIIVVYALASHRDGETLESDGAADRQTQSVEPVEPVIERVRVQARSDSAGELWIDGELHGEIGPDAPVALELEPGAYRFELRRDGSTVDEELVPVRAGAPAEVDLSIPPGSEEMDVPGETVIEPGGSTGPEQTPTMEEPPEVETAPMVENPTMGRDRPRSMSTQSGDLPMVIADNPFD